MQGLFWLKIKKERKKDSHPLKLRITSHFLSYNPCTAPDLTSTQSVVCLFISFADILGEALCRSGCNDHDLIGKKAPLNPF